jgi:hypothetical protein
MSLADLGSLFLISTWRLKRAQFSKHHQKTMNGVRGNIHSVCAMNCMFEKNMTLAKHRPLGLSCNDAFTSSSFVFHALGLVVCYALLPTFVGSPQGSSLFWLVTTVWRIQHEKLYTCSSALFASQHFVNHTWWTCVERQSRILVWLIVNLAVYSRKLFCAWPGNTSDSIYKSANHSHLVCVLVINPTST